MDSSAIHGEGEGKNHPAVDNSATELAAELKAMAQQQDTNADTKPDYPGEPAEQKPAKDLPLGPAEKQKIRTTILQRPTEGTDKKYFSPPAATKPAADTQRVGYSAMQDTAVGADSGWLGGSTELEANLQGWPELQKQVEASLDEIIEKINYLKYSGSPVAPKALDRMNDSLIGDVLQSTKQLEDESQHLAAELIRNVGNNVVYLADQYADKFSNARLALIETQGKLHYGFEALARDEKEHEAQEVIEDILTRYSDGVKSALYELNNLPPVLGDIREEYDTLERSLSDQYGLRLSEDVVLKIEGALERFVTDLREDLESLNKDATSIRNATVAKLEAKKKVL